MNSMLGYFFRLQKLKSKEPETNYQTQLSINTM
jgi:hypothetical protein